MRSDTCVLVMGGGPAGSMTAALLAREGVETMLVEKEAFPRYHIGESLLTSALPMLDFVGALENVDTHGFVRKYGGFFRVKHGVAPGHIDFTKLSRYKYSYQVVRSEFDQLLFDHAKRSGAHAYDRTRVANLTFEGDRPVAASIVAPDGSTSTVSFRFLVDATGQSGLLSARYLRNRRAEDAFANVAVGAYYRGASTYRDDSGREHPGAFSMEALTDGSGWTWAIPLHDGTLSVGVVLHKDIYRQHRGDLGSTEAVFLHGLERSPDISRLIHSAVRGEELRVWRDYSYFADAYAGPGYRLAGDAAGFIDPLFSTGVHMAFMGALSSSATICSELRGEFPPMELERFHTHYLDQAYTRLAFTVAGFYRQLRNQREVVLPGVTSASFQRAFDVIRPVVSGDLDMNSQEISADAAERAMRYTADMMLEAHEITTGNKVARFMASKSMDEPMSGHLASINGLYIRMKHGRLGVQRCGLLESIATSVRRRVIHGIVGAKERRTNGAAGAADADDRPAS